MSCPAPTPPMPVSIGVTLFRAADKDVNSILVRAAAALYQAKNKGRNRVEWA